MLNAWESPRYFLDRLELGLDIVREVGEPNVRFQYDCYHIQRMEGQLIDGLVRNLAVDRPRPDRGRARAARARHGGDPLRERPGGARSGRIRRLRGARVPALGEDRGLARLAAAGGPGAPVAADPARGPTTDHPAGRRRRGPIPVATPVRSAFRYFYEHDGFFLAAGLSFYVVICIVPFVLLVIAGSAFLISNEMVLREVVDRLGTLLPVYQAEMEAALRAVIDARGVSSLVGTLILLFFASQLFAATRLVLNRVFQHKGRGLIHGMLFDVGMILLLTVGFLASIGVTGAFAWVRGHRAPRRAGARSCRRLSTGPGSCWRCSSTPRSSW